MLESYSIYLENTQVATVAPGVL
jgi:hypothetical protein